MTNSELLLAAITNGDETDATVSAALDVLREETQPTLIGAVLEVARVWEAARDSRDMKDASEFIAPGHALAEELKRVILNECHDLPPGAVALLLIIDGSAPPQTARRVDNGDLLPLENHLVSVGAGWVKREANRIMLDRQQARLNRRRRRRR